MADWIQRIRDIPDFPEAGDRVQGHHADAGRSARERGGDRCTRGTVADTAIDAVMAIEARGFLLGAPLARELGTGLVAVRKPGKLPGR